MPHMAIYDMAGVKTRDIDVPDDVLGLSYNPDLIHQAVVAVDWARLATRNEPAAVRLTIEYANGRLQLVWSSGTLQSADDATGSYSDVSGAGSPYQIIPAGRRKFYRLRL